MPVKALVPNPNAADGQPVIIGGGTAASVPDAIAYPGPPIINPPAILNIVVDTTGQQWMYYQGAWH